MADRIDYTVEKINDQIYRINEFNIMNCFLVIGEQKALLIDCGVGAGNMAKFVRTLTDKPVTLVATHAHVDHIGAAWQFGKMYVHVNDLPIARHQTSKKERRSYLKRHPSTEKFGLDRKNFAEQKSHLFIIPFGNNRSFDLGGITVDTIYTPGHSAGSVCFKIDKYKILLVADNYIPFLSFKFNFGSSLSKWLKATEEVIPLVDEYTLYGGHGQHTVSAETVRWLKETVEDVINNTKKNDSRRNKKIVTVKDESGRNTLVYRTDKIL